MSQNFSPIALGLLGCCSSFRLETVIGRECAHTPCFPGGLFFFFAVVVTVDWLIVHVGGHCRPTDAAARIAALRLTVNR